MASAADLPKECQDRLDKVAACMSKQSGAAAAAIKANTDAFASQATAMKC